MSKGIKLVLILFVLMTTSVMFMVAALLFWPAQPSRSTGSSFSRIGTRLGVMELHGVIGDDYSISEEKVKQILDHFGKSGSVKGLVLHISSPGGGVVASEHLYYRLRAWKAKYRKPVVAYLDDVGASGAYFVACAADEILASSSCLTGSIGVVIAIQNYEHLFNNIGIHTYWIKAGRHKTAGGEYPMSEEDRAMLQSTVDDVYEQFLSIVKEGRGDKLAAFYVDQPNFHLDVKVKELAEGRIYTGRQAMGLGLVDGLGDLEDAIRRAAARAGVGEDTPVDVRETRGARPGFLFMRLPDLSGWLPVREPLLQYRLRVP